MSYEWTELAYLELQAGNTAMIVFAFAVVMVFLVLAAQYESWSLPLAVILVGADVPARAPSSACNDRASMDINIFTQIGFVVLVGLASKNAILIVEFAKQQPRAGRAAPRGDAGGLPAAAAADHDDLVGVHPRRGAAAARRTGPGPRCGSTLGTAVFSGMLGVTLFGIFLTPVFFYVIDTAERVARSSPSPLVRRVGTSRCSAILTPVAPVATGSGESARRPARRRRLAIAKLDATRPNGRRSDRRGSDDRVAGSSCEQQVRDAVFSRFFIDRPIFAVGAVDRHHAGRRHRAVHAADRAVPRDHAADRRGLGRTTPAPTPRSSPTPSPRRSSSRSTASRT